MGKVSARIRHILIQYPVLRWGTECMASLIWVKNQEDLETPQDPSLVMMVMISSYFHFSLLLKEKELQCLIFDYLPIL